MSVKDKLRWWQPVAIAAVVFALVIVAQFSISSFGHTFGQTDGKDSQTTPTGVTLQAGFVAPSNTYPNIMGQCTNFYVDCGHQNPNYDTEVFANSSGGSSTQWANDTFTSNYAVGEVFVICDISSASATAATVSDTAGLTYTMQENNEYSSAAMSMWVWTATFTATLSSDVITCKSNIGGTAALDTSMIVFDVIGIDVAAPLDKLTGAYGPTEEDTAGDTGMIAFDSLENYDFVVGFGQCKGMDGVTAGSGFTKVSSGGEGDTVWAEYDVVGESTTTTVDLGSSGSACGSSYTIIGAFAFQPLESAWTQCPTSGLNEGTLSSPTTMNDVSGQAMDSTTFVCLNDGALNGANGFHLGDEVVFANVTFSTSAPSSTEYVIQETIAGVGEWVAYVKTPASVVQQANVVLVYDISESIGVSNPTGETTLVTQCSAVGTCQ